LIWSLVVILAVMACGISIDTGGETPENQAPPTSTNPPPVEPSPLPPPTETPAAEQPSPTVQEAEATEPPQQPSPTSSPQCTVLQDLFFRTGPGTAYDPPVRALEPQTVLVPQGYNPVGVPGGPWVQVREPQANLIGWVSAGEQYVDCNIDLTSLPSVAVEPPPPPAPPKTGNSAPDGSFPDNLIFQEDFNRDYLYRLYAHDINVGEEDGDGIAAIEFTIRDAEGNLVHSNSEETPGFCVFGGGEPACNTWLLDEYVYKWASTGIPVEDGVYELRVRVILDDDSQGDGNWSYELTVDLD
jgi:hypothetical protein